MAVPTKQSVTPTTFVDTLVNILFVQAIYGLLVEYYGMKYN